MKFLLKILLFLLGAQSAYAVEEWQNFSEPFPIRDAAAADQGVWLATDGGMRYKDNVDDIVYGPAKGLGASAFSGVVNTPKGVYAVSEYGLIARLNDDFYKWTVLSTSFLSAGDPVVPGMVEYSGNILVIAFENKIAFVSLETGISLLSIERIGNISLSMYTPEKIEIRGDSLYVETSRGTFVRQMDWEHLAEDKRLVDPEKWTRVEGVCLHCRDSLRVVVNGKTLEDSLFYRDGKSVVEWQFDLGNGLTYLVGHNLIVRYENGRQEDLTKYEPFQLSGAYEVQAVPEGGVIAASQDGHLAADLGAFWFEPVLAFQGFGNNTEATSNRIKTLSVLPGDLIMYHVWGLGYHLYMAMGYNHIYSIVPWDNTCMETLIDSITVTVGTTPAPDGSGFLAAPSAHGGYGVDYVTRETDISCASKAGSSVFAGPLVARVDPKNSDWIVYVSTRENLSAFARGGMDILRFPSPSKNGGRLLDPERKTIAGLDDMTPIDMAIDEEREVLWLVTSTGVGYMEFDSDTIRKPTSMNGLLGAEYTSIDVDPQGNVWLGTTSQGIFRLARRNGSLDTLSVSHYTMRDGLLNNMVLDLTVDKKIGVVWMAHENGISCYQRNDLRKIKDFMTDSAEVDVMVFPVPFRPRVHAFLTIDNISDESRVDIYNRGGSLIRSFSKNDVAGGRIEWNGTGKNGQLVSPGVYYYVVRAPSKTKKGKFIVIH